MVQSGVSYKTRYETQIRIGRGVKMTVIFDFRYKEIKHKIHEIRTQTSKEEKDMCCSSRHSTVACVCMHSECN